MIAVHHLNRLKTPTIEGDSDLNSYRETGRVLAAFVNITTNILRAEPLIRISRSTSRPRSPADKPLTASPTQLEHEDENFFAATGNIFDTGDDLFLTRAHLDRDTDDDDDDDDDGT